MLLGRRRWPDAARRPWRASVDPAFVRRFHVSAVTASTPADAVSENGATRGRRLRVLFFGSGGFALDALHALAASLYVNTQRAAVTVCSVG